MQGTTLICTHCECRVEHDNIPIVLYLVAGVAPLHPQALGKQDAIDITDIPMPELLRKLFSEGGRWEFCVGCFAKLFNLPLVDKNGAIEASADAAKEHLKAWKPPVAPTPPRVPVNEEARLRQENAELQEALSKLKGSQQ